MTWTIALRAFAAVLYVLRELMAVYLDWKAHNRGDTPA